MEPRVPGVHRNRPPRFEDALARRAEVRWLNVAIPGCAAGAALGFLLCDDYGADAGTSMAAPLVTGLAALVLSAHDFSAAQVKACIVAGANNHGLAANDQGLHVIEAPSAVTCGDTLGFPSKVDVLFSLDLTGSMADEISQVKAHVSEVMASLRQAAPGTDFRFGVVSYEDYPGYYDSRACGSTYAATYGGAAESPFRINVPLTSDDTAVSATVNGLATGWGADGPQSYGRVYWEAGQPDTMSALGNRPDAMKLLIDFGDDVPHDSDLNEGMTSPPPPITPFDTGRDPGRDGLARTADDIDFQTNAIPALVHAGVHLVRVDSSGNDAYRLYWTKWASDAIGQMAAINPDGSIPGGVDLAQMIIQVLQLVA